MRYPPQFLDDIRARISVSQVVGKRVPLKRQGREFAGLSPFKTEKTPSFFVNDQKGFYHCFSSGEHGDIFSFLTKVEGLSFPEAVERLAAEAGLEVPRASPQVERQVEERKGLQQLVEAAAVYFERQLASNAGREARTYLERRGVSAALQAQFRLGFAPDSRNGLKQYLANAGYSVADMVVSGMLIGGDDIPMPYDRFRGRLMIPIQDLKGQVIAFGGRALAADAKPKYLNSPETPLFHKGSVLFNQHRARTVAHQSKSLIVVEGYLDVIALAGAGLGAVVAPLGTALTEAQLGLIWRIAAEPTLCFDGDAAGRKAAHRAIDTALPHLGPEATLRIAFLPGGLDPDDLVRQHGADAMRAVLKTALPLADALWEREVASGTWTTPERRAQLEQRLRGLTATIADPGVRTHYQMGMRERLRALWQPTRSAGSRAMPGAGGQRSFKPGAGRPGASKGGAPRAPWDAPNASDSLRLAVAQSGQSASAGREALLMRALLSHPWLIGEMAEEVSRLTLRNRACQQVRDGLLALLASGALDAGHDGNPLDNAGISSHLTLSGSGEALAAIQRIMTHRADKFAEPGADEGSVRAGWLHTLAVHRRDIDLGEELAAAERAFRADGSEAAWAAICEIKQRIDSLAAGSTGSPS